MHVLLIYYILNKKKCVTQSPNTFQKITFSLYILSFFFGNACVFDLINMIYYNLPNEYDFLVDSLMTIPDTLQTRTFFNLNMVNNSGEYIY